jgi:hypothetical protein
VATEQEIFDIAQTIEGEWPFDATGQLLVALSMANRIRLRGDKAADLLREYFGWQQERQPSDWARVLAAKVLDGTLSNVFFCFSTDDVVNNLPRLGYAPGPADLEYNHPTNSKYGLRLYVDEKGWAIKKGEKENGCHSDAVETGH